MILEFWWWWWWRWQCDWLLETSKRRRRECEGIEDSYYYWTRACGDDMLCITGETKIRQRRVKQKHTTNATHKKLRLRDDFLLRRRRDQTVKQRVRRIECGSESTDPRFLFPYKCTESLVENSQEPIELGFSFTISCRWTPSTCIACPPCGRICRSNTPNAFTVVKKT